MNLKTRLIKLESSIIIKTEPIKSHPFLSEKQWEKTFVNPDIEAEPFTIEQQEWVNKYGGVS